MAKEQKRKKKKLKSNPLPLHSTIHSTPAMNRLTLLKPSSPFSRSLLRSPHPHPHPHPHPSTIRFASSSQSTRSAIGAFTLPSALLFSLTGLGLYYYFQHEKGLQQERKLAETANAKIGKPKIGGEFVLTDQDGKEWGSKDMKGKWCLVYVCFSSLFWVKRGRGILIRGRIVWIHELP